jgi:outer membrane protein
MMCKVLTLGTICFIFISIIFSQTDVLSLDDCIKIALINNSQLRISGYQKESLKQDVLGSYAGILPTIDLSGYYSKYERGETYYIGSTRILSPLPGEDGKNYSFDASLNQNIFDGGIWWNRIKQAKANNQAQQYLHMNQTNIVIETVQQRYYELLRENKLLDVYKLAIDRSKSQMEKTEKMFELGAVAKVDVYRARVNLGTDSIAYLTQINTVKLSENNLNIPLGRNPREKILIKDEFELNEDIENADSLLKIANENNPSLIKTEYDIRSASLNRKMAYGRLSPQLGLFINYSRRVPEFSVLYGDFNREYTFTYGIGIRFNLFNGFQDYVAIQKAKLNEKYYQESQIVTRRNLESSIDQYYENFKSLLDIIKINRKNLEAAKEEYRLAEERYRIGSGTSLELREAQVNLTRAEQILVAAQYNARITQAQLENALGTISKKYIHQKE